MRVLVTGASGYIGSILSKNLSEKGYFVKAIISKGKVQGLYQSKYIKYFEVNKSDSIKDWKTIFTDIDCVVHCAGLNQSPRGILASKKLDILRKNNVSLSSNIINYSAESGVKRFIFISSIKVNGEKTEKNVFFNNKQPPNPKDSYAQSKCEAEINLKKIASRKNIELVIIRPPMVYGSLESNPIKKLIKIIGYGFPIPLKLVDNLRSYIFIDNLIDFIGVCISHPKAINQTFLISDGRDISTPDLIKLIALLQEKKVKLIPFNLKVLKLLASFIGLKSTFDKLVTSNRIDTSHAFNELEWRPKVKIEEGIRKMLGLG